MRKDVLKALIKVMAKVDITLFFFKRTALEIIEATVKEMKQNRVDCGGKI